MGRGFVGRETYEKVEGNEMSIEDGKKELEKIYSSGNYKIELIKRTLNDNPKLRKTFASLILINPARLGDIQQKVFIERKSIYRHLYHLKEMGLLKQVGVMGMWNKEEKDLNEEQKEILKKFKDWTERMTDKQVAYFAAKTNYFVLTDLGKSKELVGFVVSREKEIQG